MGHERPYQSIEMKKNYNNFFKREKQEIVTTLNLGHNYCKKISAIQITKKGHTHTAQTRPNNSVNCDYLRKVQ